MQALPSYPLDEIDPDALEDDASAEPDEEVTRPPLRSGVELKASLDHASFNQRADLEWRLHHRGRFAQAHHRLAVPTLERLEAMFDRLPRARSMQEAVQVVHGAFVHDEERRAALVPLLDLLYPLAYFDDRMPTADVVRMIAHYERRTPSRAP